MNDKRCSKCGEIKPLDAFSKDQGNKDGRDSRCKACRAAYLAAYYARPDVKAKAAAYNATPEAKARKAARRATPEDKAKVAAYSARPEVKAKRDARYATPEGKASKVAYNRAYHAEHREGIAARSRAYRESPEGKAKVAAYDARPEVKARRATRNAIYQPAYNARPEVIARKAAYRATPEAKALDVAKQHRRRAWPGARRLTAEIIQEVHALAGGFCAYCNQHFAQGQIDHIQAVSRLGTNDADNLVSICGPCNMSKADRTLLEFMLYRRTTRQGATQ